MSLSNSQCPLLAQSRHALAHCQCPLLGVKRTWPFSKFRLAYRESYAHATTCGGYITNATNLRATIVKLASTSGKSEPIFDCFGLMEEERAKVKGANHEYDSKILQHWD